VGTALIPTTPRPRRRPAALDGYNRLLRLALRARFSDAQCGFKAIPGNAARELLGRPMLAP
jgi:hypothetical protein